MREGSWKERNKDMTNSHGFTVFVDNLPQVLDRYGLKGIFRKAESVSDSYIPLKQDRSRKRYNFVRFWKEEDAMNNILVLNSTTIRGATIRVCMAKYDKGSIDSNANQAFKQSWRRKLKQKERKVWKEKASQANQVRSNHMEQAMTTTLKGEMNAEFMEWLTRSVVCESKEPRDLEVLSKALVKDDCSKMYVLSKFKFIFTYHTVEQMEESLKNREKLDKWFQEVKKWDVYEVCDTR